MQLSSHALDSSSTGPESTLESCATSWEWQPFFFRPGDENTFCNNLSLNNTASVNAKIKNCAEK